MARGLYTSHWLSAIAAAVQEAARQLPEGRGLRILEIGAGTGGLAAQVLPLLERGLHSYTFSDVSAGFFPSAMQKLAAFPEVETKIFDLERPGTEQGFEAGSFDFVIGTNVLHAVSDVRAALEHVRDLLAAGGSLVFMDVANPQLWTEAVFGLTAGWWRFTDRDLRPQQPLLERATWERVLREAGFDETASLPGLDGPDRRRRADRSARRARPGRHLRHNGNSRGGTDGEIVADFRGRVRDWEMSLPESLRSRGCAMPGCAAREAVCAPKNGEFHAPCGSARGLAETPASVCGRRLPLERIVYLWNLDAPADVPAGDAIMGTDALLHLSQALDAVLPMTSLRIDSVTRGAQPVGREPAATAVAQAPAVGLLRVILNEHPNFSCRGIDLPPASSAADLDLLWSELLGNDAEREIAFRGEARYAQRLDRGRPLHRAMASSRRSRCVSNRANAGISTRCVLLLLPCRRAGRAK